jgi:hypothetical protein
VSRQCLGLGALGVLLLLSGGVAHAEKPIPSEKPTPWLTLAWDYVLEEPMRHTGFGVARCVQIRDECIMGQRWTVPPRHLSLTVQAPRRGQVVCFQVRALSTDGGSPLSNILCLGP